MPIHRVKIIKRVAIKVSKREIKTGFVGSKALNVKSVHLILRDMGMDKVSLETDIPDPIDPGNLWVDFAVPRDTGEAFIKRYFSSIKFKITNARFGTDRYKFGEGIGE